MASNRKFNVPINLLSLSSDPASADEGDVYYNTTDDRIRVYKNSTWVNLAYADDVGIVSTDYITFDTTPEATIPATQGTLSWDSGESGLNLTANSNVDLKIGQQNVVLVKNATGSSISKGSVVYINGAAGQRPTIALSDADTEATSSKTLGLTAETIADGAEGFVTTFGVQRGVNTLGMTEGAAVWLSSTAGAFTTTIPAEPAHSVFIGYVVKASASAGEIFVNPQNGYELTELHGVTIDGTPADNEVLAYDTTSGLWINQTSAEAGLIDTSSTAQTKTGNFTSSGDISAGGVLKSTASAANEGGQIELSVPSSGTTLSGTNVTIDVYQDKLRFFESGGTNRGAYIPLTSTGASVATSLLGGTTGAMNASYTYASKQSNVSGATTLASVSITTNGYPIQVLATGDMENNSAGGWVTLQLYRDSTAIGNIVHAESSAGSENVPFALTALDVPAAGTYTYSLKTNGTAGGTFNFGESNGPTITVIELSGPKGDTGAAGTSPNAFTTIATTSGTSPVADSTSDTLTLSAGTGITITGDSSTDTITIASTITDTNTTYDLTTSGTSTATVSLAGSDATTDSFTITGSGATTVSHSAGAITISSTDTNTTYSPATSTVAGLIELFSDTVQSTAANAVTSTASRTYGVQVNASGQAVVNVPWTDTDTNTTYDLTTSGTSTATINLVPSSGATDSFTITGSGATTISHSAGAITVTSTDLNYYPSAIVWNAGTTAGPTLDLTMSGAGAPDLTAVAIPSASSTASGVVTTTTQTFAGAKEFTGAINMGSTLDVAGLITGDGNLSIIYIGAGTAGVPNSGTAFLSENSAVDSQTLRGGETNASYTGNMTRLNKNRASDTSSTFLVCYSSFSGTPDLDAQIRGDGRMSSDLAFVGTGADYAEYFEWLDGNPNNEDRTGKSVILSGNKIVLATENSDSIIGVVSANADIIGDSAWNNWQGRWVTDSFNRRIQEEYNVWQWEKEINGKTTMVAYEEGFIPEDEVVPENYTIVVQKRDKQNPEWNSEEEYVPREYRKEWSTIGLLGKIRIYKGQPVNPRWIKMRDIDEQVEEWLVR